MSDKTGGTLARGVGGDTFGALLDRLKRRGTSVLVVGDLSPELERTMSRRMMGHPRERRYRLLALLKPDADRSRWFPDGVEPRDEWVRVLDRAGLARGAAASAPGADAGPKPPADRLADDVADWVATVDREADPDPGQLRVGVASLDALEAVAGRRGASDVASTVHELMRRHGGLAHLYFPRPRDSVAVEHVAVWADVVVEVRTAAGRPEQRWILQDELETSWFPIRDDVTHHRTD